MNSLLSLSSERKKKSLATLYQEKGTAADMMWLRIGSLAVMGLNDRREGMHMMREVEMGEKVGVTDLPSN